MDFSINSNISNMNVASKKLDADLINKKQQPYRTKPKSDTLELSTSTPKKQGFFQKWGKTLAVAGATIGLVLGGIVLKKKIDVRKAKKLEEQARQIANEQAERARIEAENARIAAEKAKAERLKELQEKARLKAEQEAKLKAEKEAEAQRLAKLAEEKAYKAKVDGMRNAYSEKYSLNRDLLVTSDVHTNLTKYTSDEFLEGIVETVKMAEKDGVKESDIINLYSEIKTSTKSVKLSYNNEYEQNWYEDTLNFVMNKRQSGISDLEALEQTIVRKDGETFGEYLSRLVETRRNNLPKDNGIATVKAKLHYENAPQQAVELTAEEMDRLAKWKPDVYEGLSKEEALSRVQGHARGWTSAYTDDCMNTSAFDEVEDILLNKGFPRYNSSTVGNSGDYDVEPLYRWLRIQKGNYKLNPDGSVNYNSKITSLKDFVDESFVVGEEYVAPKLQSCSKNKGYAETYFHDDNPEMTVKLVIHPKGTTSKAVDIGCGRYGDNEAIYVGGTRFRVLNKRQEECINRNYSENSTVNGQRVFSRWIVDLQEI